MSPNTLLDRSLAFRQDDMFAAEADADATTEELADFASRVELWGEVEMEVFADLQRREHRAEGLRRASRDRYVWEFTNYIRQTLNKKADHE